MPLISHKKYKQHIGHHFADVIMMIKQMCQQDNIVFQQLLKIARTGHLTQNDVDFLNSKVSEELLIGNKLFSVVIIQTNTKRHLINQHQIYKMAREKS